MATEVPSCSTAADTQSHVSVVQYVRFLSKDYEEKAMVLYKEWQELLETLVISRSVRETMDDWFVDVYNAREEVRRMESDKLHHMIDDKESMLYEKFRCGMEAQITASRSHLHSSMPNNFAGLQLKSDLDQIEQDYSSLEWVKKAIECMEHERKLIQKYSEEPSHGEHTREQDRIIEEQISECEIITKEVDRLYSSCARELESFSTLCNDVDKQTEVLENMTFILENRVQKNGMFSCDKKNQLAAKVQLMEERRKKMNDELFQMIKNLMEQLKAAVEQFRVLTSSVSVEIKDWKLQFQYNYAQIYATPDLDRISPWCEKTGRMLDELQKLFMKTRNLFTDVGWQWAEEGEPYEATLLLMYQAFFQSSLVVVEQEDFVIKVDKKSFPKITVRFLAAEGLGLGGTKIEARFVFEDFIRLATESDLDQELLLKKERKIQGGQVQFQDKGKNKWGTFSSMKFKEKDFPREDIPNLMVHDEKYRLVFLTNFKGHEFWTLSLPLVVTTGANQSCRALASIMWQCFSTDVHHVPIERKDELPWSQVAKMVNQKMRRLCQDRHLSEENLTHLKLRLFGGQAVPDDEKVSLKRFCFDKMFKADDAQCTFSFWKWFLANYNLLDKYLLDYWKKGLIEGFVSKEDCIMKFKKSRCQKNGLFILRFSDQHINDSQGVKNIFGHLTSVVSSIVEEKGEKKRRVNHLEVAGHNRLKDKNLANILKETLDKHHHLVYQHLFPGDRSREEAFDTYCKKGPIVDGYQGTHDAFIVDLEHAVSALKLSTGKHCSPSSDSSTEVTPAAASRGGKRMRSVNEEKHPTLIQMLARRPAADSPASNHDSSSQFSSPQPSPAFSIQSPATEERLGHDMLMLSGTPQNSPAYSVQSPGALEAELRNQNCIPKVVEELSSDESTMNSNVSQMRNNVPQVLPTNRVDSQNSVPRGYAANQVEQSIDQWGIHGNFQDLSLQQGQSQQTNRTSPSSNENSQNEVIIFVHPDQNCIEIDGNDSNQSPNQLQPFCQSANQLLSNASQDFRLFQSSPQLMQWLQNMPADTPQPLREALVQSLQSRTDVSSPGPALMAMDNTPDDIQMMNSSSGGSNTFLDSAAFDEAQQMDSGTIDCSVFDVDDQTY